MGMDAHHLSQLLDRAADSRPGHPAVEDERGQTFTYQELRFAADRLATRLNKWGVGRGDRVGLFLPKGREAVAAIHGVLRSGAAYVPVDPGSPAVRGAGILADAGVKAVVVDATHAAALRDAWPIGGPIPRFIVEGGEGPCPTDASWDSVMTDDAPAPLPSAFEVDDLAYILYTSGSTGRPKGVMLSHANAFAFIDWCDQSFDLRGEDRFASHAPFHFDLSIFDLYASCGVGATLVLIGESTGKDPAKLGRFLGDRAISVWYSAPSILALMAEYGGLASPGVPAPRLVLFAGEVFPIAPLKKLRRAWPGSQMWNLYGPTETNVCTAFPIPPTIDDDREAPFPIGPTCAPALGKVIDEHGRELPSGAVGELVVNGPGVMLGYFGRPDLTARAFFLDDRGAWYRTGDLVSDDGTGTYRFHGRRDRMVKKRGYRIELGEIEAAIYRHDGVDRAAVIARATDDGVSLVAFIAMKPGRKGSIIALKRHCTTLLPPYMVPDEVQFLSDFPTTSTDKVDYQGLKRMVSTVAG
ncbi:amino acid adenylation domain-containing protein [Tundrisphaera lichenicola]|uniref:amino acid adenylation domain-containing protein n=1 Tax=Tundrisphaera lichenicola TaxID=2029860 RepID=UPI003EBE6B5F